MFGRNKSKTRATPAHAAGVATVFRSDVITDLETNQALALGLSWCPIISNDYARAATDAALKAKASHYVVGERVGFVGTTSLPSDITKGMAKSGPKLEVLSLARLFACSQRSDSTSAYVLDLDGAFFNKVWLCHVKNGSVQQGYDLIIDRELAHSKLTDLAAQHADLIVYGNLAFDGIAIDNGFPLISLLEQLRNGEARRLSTLTTVKKSLAQSFARLPKPFRVFLYAVAAIVAYNLISPAVGMLHRKFTKPVVPVEDAVALWGAAIADGLAKYSLATPDALPVLLTNLEVVPTTVGGWTLKTVQCDAATVAKKWNCKASYDLTAYGATNIAFDKAKPSNWSVEWLPLKKVNAVFSYPLTTQPIKFLALGTKADHLLNTATLLQKLQPALKDATKPISDFAPIKIDPPKYANNDTVAPIQGLQLPLTAAVTLTGPLRATSIINELSQAVSWRSIKITHDPAVKPDRNSSALTMELTGDIYAKP